MAIKQDLDAIKDQIGAEEQFLESIIKGEKLLKKYKYPLIGAVVAVILFVVGHSIINKIEENRLISSNEAYQVLLNNPEDKEALETLKSNNTNLYETYLFQRAVLSKKGEELRKVLNSDADPLLKDIAHFVLKDGSSKILQEVSYLLQGYNHLKEGKSEDAKKVFSNIPLSSSLQDIVKKLNHYQGN